jgi:iduronate 2-sulfatase
METLPFAPCVLPGGCVTSVFSNSSKPEEVVEEAMSDAMIAAHAVEILQQLGENAVLLGKPFFLAVGLHKPHLPHIAPAKYFDLYEVDKISLPSNASRYPPSDAPDAAWAASNGCSEFKMYADVNEAMEAGDFDKFKPFNDSYTRAQRRAYYAAATFADAQIGKVLKALEASGRAESTVVTLWGDHGWCVYRLRLLLTCIIFNFALFARHIGENNEWAKHTAMTWANRVPLLFSMPQQRYGKNGGGVVSQSFAELVDVMPTLLDLAGLPLPPTCSTPEMSRTSASCTEGASLKPLMQLADESLPAHSASMKYSAAFGQWPSKKLMGYNLYTFVTPDWAIAGSSAPAPGYLVRYTEWVSYNKSSAGAGPIWESVSGVELYNRTADPDENQNLANKPEMAEVVKQLRTKLHAGWRGVNNRWRAASAFPSPIVNTSMGPVRGSSSESV